MRWKGGDCFTEKDKDRHKILSTLKFCHLRNPFVEKMSMWNPLKRF
jgi:hypothetical protein